MGLLNWPPADSLLSALYISGILACVAALLAIRYRAAKRAWQRPKPPVLVIPPTNETARSVTRFRSAAARWLALNFVRDRWERSRILFEARLNYPRG